LTSKAVFEHSLSHAKAECAVDLSHGIFMEAAAWPKMCLMPYDAIILSGPDFYEAHIARLYGGYKRTQNLYGRAPYQKDPAQVDAERNDAYIYFSLFDRKCPSCNLRLLEEG
jgi:hypothetical protein